MKAMFAVIAAAMLSSPVLAQEAEATQPTPQMQRDMADWARSLAEKQAAESKQSDDGAGVRQGRLRIIPLAELDAPTSIKERTAEGIQRKRRGPLDVAPGTLPSTSEVMAGLTHVRRSDAELRERLSYAPADISRTPIGTSELLSTEPNGTLNGDRSTGVTRVFRLPDGAIVLLAEDDYHASGTTLTLIREALNADVNGTPARSYAARSKDGRGKAELWWVTPERSYRLTFITDHGARIRQGERLLLDIAKEIRS